MRQHSVNVNRAMKLLIVVQMMELELSVTMLEVSPLFTDILAPPTNPRTYTFWVLQYFNQAYTIIVDLFYRA